MSTFSLTFKNWKLAAGAGVFACFAALKASQQPLWWWGFAVIVLCFGMLLCRRKEYVREFMLDDKGISYRFGWEGGDIKVGQLAWESVQRIVIQTTNAGPWDEDFFFVLCGPGDSGVLIGNDDACKLGLLAELQSRFPGLDDEMVIKASGCTSNAFFPLWSRGAAQSM